MSFDTTNNPVLSADFAERVLARADVVVSRRRRVHRVTGGFAALAFVSVAAISWLAMSGMMQSTPPRQDSQFVALADTQADEPDVLTDFFPDAASIASFETQYSDATDGPDTALFSDQDPTS
jgi:hypothetical protein